MRFGEFKKEVQKHNPKADIVIIQKAFEYARKNHRDQKRVSGEPYFEHPLAVSLILAHMRADSSTICAGLLHDLIEDTKVDFNDIKHEFGEEVAYLVEGVTKIDKMYFSDKKAYNAENLRKILLATSKDIRVMFIKLADRLHNMRTLKNLRIDKQQRISKETVEIYSPIAHKLGIWHIKGELEDLALRYLKPEVYEFLRSKINSKRAVREKQTSQFIKIIKSELEKNKIKCHVYGRAKYFFSIYKKMLKKNLEFDQIYDLIAIRIITKNISYCYAALNVIHNMWEPIKERFKDYISVPKPNGYQCIHTTVMGGSKIIEFQIRTEDMHSIAENGVAAHWKYQGTERDKRFEQKISWIKQLLDWRASDHGDEFIESLKLDLFQNEIVVFTPKGDPISLRDGSTPVDFAFEVHTNVGLACSKAMVNGNVVTLDYKLKPGDIVEIITSKSTKPSRNWLKFVKTTKAKSKIRSILKIDSDSPRKGKTKTPEKTVYGIIINDQKYAKSQLKLSKCCSPESPDKIVGYLTKDRKVTVHKKGCPNIYMLSQLTEIQLSWADKKERDALVLGISVKNSPGIFGEILKLLSNNKLKIVDINSKAVRDHMYMRINVEKSDVKALRRVIKDLRSLEDVIDAKEVTEHDM
ncbi:bifunctional (p)ppGpp synthetase/guanosine-3',5'-bis(diphosphate) 3'-pyrophosphohydrolase [Candidatus Woesearchaeota archaeon]|nr:bifunctional (p)ppGpp synthetase/guanosine-3',5'-bis(diphosphate) 3'-pyrophosphohydrolase [Candidatus Woesearchaeota archaeon]